MGWTNRGSEAPIPRQDIPPQRFYEEKLPADPAGPAWDEPGYEDTERAHARLPLGTRYWQGFAKKSAPAQEEPRALSPEWVARVTENAAIGGPPHAEEMDPLRERVVRVKERERIQQDRFVFPG